MSLLDGWWVETGVFEMLDQCGSVWVVLLRAPNCLELRSPRLERGGEFGEARSALPPSLPRIRFLACAWI